MSFINSDKLDKSLLTRSLYFLIIVIYFFWIFKTYAGNHHSVYLHMSKYALGLFPFTYDIYVQSCNLLEVSIFYKITSFLKIDLDNDYVGFSLHIICTSIAGYYLFKFIKNFTPIKETNGALIAIFSLLVIGGTLVQATRSSWVYDHTGSITYFSHFIIFVFIWFLIKRSPHWLFILSTLMLLIAVKHTWFVVGTGIVYSILFFRPLKNNYWAIGPIAVLIYLSTLGEMPSDYNSRVLIWNSILTRDEAEVAFHLQSPRYLISLIISFPIFLLMLLKLQDSKFKNLSFVVLILSFLCFIFGYFYALYGASIWAEPRILALSPTRAFLLYQLFFWILVIIHIYNSKFYSLVKIALCCSMFYGFTGLWKNSYLVPFIYFLFIMFSTFVTIKIFERKNFFNLQKIMLNRSAKFSTFITLLFFLSLLPGTTYLFYKTLTISDFYALKKINKWTIGPLIKDHQRLDNLIDLQKCEDFVLMDIKYPLWSSAISGKSHYWEPGWQAYNHFDLYLYKTAHKRQKIFINIKNKILKKAKMSQDDIKELINSDVVLIVNDEDSNFFSESVLKINLRNKDTLVLFLKDPQKKYFINNCKQYLKI